MIIGRAAGGTFVVTQPAHARLAADIGAAWGNDRFGHVARHTDLILAAARHEEGWRSWESRPELDPSTGLPRTFRQVRTSTHLRVHERSQRLLVETGDTYPALLVSLHHASGFRDPPAWQRVRPARLDIHRYLRRWASLQRELNDALDVSADELARNKRLLRVWDVLSHDLITYESTATYPAVPVAEGAPVDVVLRRQPDAAGVVVDPWPFSMPSVTVATEGRVLEDTYQSRDAMLDALRRAPTVAVDFVLVDGAA